ncbi:amino acid ABC transporter permease, partial [bacterium M00.F.Ca.ET.191.01.1.1]
MSLRDFGPNELMFLLLATRWTILLALIAFAGATRIAATTRPIRPPPAKA